LKVRVDHGHQALHLLGGQVEVLAVGHPGEHDALAGRLGIRREATAPSRMLFRIWWHIRTVRGARPAALSSFTHAWISPRSSRPGGRSSKAGRT
jgi:hypothetical protein